MFADIASGLQSGPNGGPSQFVQLSHGTGHGTGQAFQTPPGMIAEPAKVMVLVPGTRAEKAETALASLRQYINIFIGLFILVIVAVIYFWLRRKPKTEEYLGSALPGIIFDSQKLKDLTKKAAVSKAAGNKTASVQIGPTASSVPPAPQVREQGPPKILKMDPEDIIKIDGPLPIWTVESDDSNTVEPRVSENDQSIANIIKARESLTKEIEQFMSTGIKTS